jgi:hypothetical protein
MNNAVNPTTLPFGKHRNTPLADVPTGYLQWLLREAKLSSGLRSAVADELRRRNIRPPAATVPPPPACSRCGPGPAVCYSWAEDRRGRKYIRRQCSACGRWLGHAPLAEPYRMLADRAATLTPILDVLVRCEDAGVRLRNDGAAIDFASTEDYRKAPDDLRRAVRQVRHTLATMLPRNRETTP